MLETETADGPAEAVARLREEIRNEPFRPEGHFRLGGLLNAIGDTTGAVASLRRTLALVPSFTGGWNNLALILAARSRLPAAAVALRRILAADPDSADAWNNLGNVLLQIADAETAVGCYRAATVKDPANHVLHANLINALRLVDGVSGEDELAECRRFADRHAASHPALAPARPRVPDRRLRVGYVGADSFRFHTASRSILPLIEAHDPNVVEAVCFSDLAAQNEDEFTARFRAAARFVPTPGLSDAALAETIVAEEIDILVDVIGYPRGSRLLALARRPAPVQVNLLLMGSFGLDAVDWAIGDAVLTPPGSETSFSEKIERIDLAFAFDPLMPTPPLSALPAASGFGVTFGSLNQTSKLSRRCIATWSRILKQVPKSRLMLKGRAYADATIAARVRLAFAENGIDSRRLDLRGWTVSQASHLDTYRKIDIALDPFPYGGVITTCEAMWMGVPVVSLEGDRVLGRYGGAFLRTVGLEKLAVASEDAYVDAAVALASDLVGLAELRRDLRPRMAASRLCDGKAFARAVEGAYRRMWHAWCGQA